MIELTTSSIEESNYKEYEESNCKEEGILDLEGLGRLRLKV